MNRKSNYADMDKYKKTARLQRKRYYAKTQDAENRYQPWTQAHIDLVMEHKISDTELSALIGRSVRAIQAMRAKEKAAEKNR